MPGDASLAVRLCAALGWYWWLRGHRAEGAEASAAALALPNLPSNSKTAMVLAMAALTSIGSVRDMAQIRGWLDRAEEISATVADEEDRHPVLRILGVFKYLFSPGHDRQAQAELVPLFDDPDPWLRSFARAMHGFVDINLGQAAEAGRHFTLAEAGFREVGERWGISVTLTAQAEIAGWRGEHRRAVAMHEEAMRRSLRAGRRADLGRCARPARRRAPPAIPRPGNDCMIMPFRWGDHAVVPGV